MTDIATLGLRINATGAEEAADSLKKLERASRNAESAANALEMAEIELSAAQEAGASDANRLATATKALEAAKRRDANATAYLQKVQANHNAVMASSSTAMRSNAMSAGQLSMAMRQLPMQFTDIAVSLSSGQSPMMVLLQQGGQLKDSFGGIGAAAKAMGGYIAGLANPYTIAAAAIAGFAIAVNAAQERAEAFARSSIITGGFAGTADQIRAISEEIDRVNGVTSGTADSAAVSIANLGRITGDAAKLASEATARWSAATGDDVDAVVAKFAEISKDPLTALDKLNEGEHFLTEAQRERIKTLIAEGDQQAAAAEAAKIYAGVMIDRAQQVEAEMSTASYAIRTFKDGVSQWWKEASEGADLLASDIIDAVGRMNAAMGKAKPLAYAVMPGSAAIASFAGASRDAKENAGGSGGAGSPTVDSKAAAEADAAMEALKASQLRYASSAEKFAAEREAAAAKYGQQEAAARKAGLVAQADAIKAGGAQVLAAMDAQHAEEVKRSAGRGKRGGGRGDNAAEKAARDAQREVERIQAAVREAENRAAVERVRAQEGESAAKRLELAQRGILGEEQNRIIAAQEIVAGIKAQEEAARAYKRVIDAIKTPEERALSIAGSDISAIEGSAAPQAEKDKAMQASAKANMGEAPSLGGMWTPEQIETAAKTQQDWYDSQLEMLTLYREAKFGTDEYWNEQELLLAQTNAERLAAIDQAKRDMQFDAMQQGASDMTTVMGAIFGEQSKQAKAAFMAEKAIAIARIMMNAPQIYSNTVTAWSSMGPWGAAIGQAMGIAAVAAQMIQVAKVKSINPTGMAHDGIDSIPKTGTWILEKGERVTTAGTSARLDRTLSRIESGMADKQSGGGQSAGVNFGGVTIVQQGRADNRTPEQNAREMRKMAFTVAGV